MWEIYDALIEGIAPQERVEFACRGRWQAFVSTGADAGLATLLLAGKQPYPDAQEFPALAGRTLREVAALVKSWDGVEAALGMAAINAWYGRRRAMAAAGAALYAPEEDCGDVFAELREPLRGKSVSIVGHFGGAWRLDGSAREVRVFEREPRPGDYPDPAEEYLLPGSDAVIITGMAFTNKTLPRLLELARGSFVALTGPSVAMSPALRAFGVRELYGMAVWDVPGCQACVLSDAEHRTIWKHVGKAVMRFE